VDSPRAPRIDLWVGIHDAGHATALGKCILGQLPGADREEYLSRHPLHDLTPRTVVDRRWLRLPGPDGVAVDEGEYAVGIRCRAVAVPTPGGVCAVAVVLSPAVTDPGPALRTGAGRVGRALALAG
jgi:IclR family transcriptional regulator, acetate operon repressor